jgi:hypothetical protein
MTPSGDRSVDPQWWTVRLNAFRAMQMQDEFELAALDYCVTYESLPLAWEEARCSYQSVAGGGETGNISSEVGGSDLAPTQLAGMSAGASMHGEYRLELRGQVLGDAAPLLDGLDVREHKPGLITVSCDELVRVDFSAAGSILNWAATRESEGCKVQFHNVHRLVAAFFNVIGINEHSRVIPRPV